MVEHLGKLLRSVTFWFRLFWLASGISLAVYGATIGDSTFGRVLAGIGTSLIGGGLVAIFFSAATESAIDVFRKEAGSQLSKDVSSVVRIESAAIRTYVHEIQKSVYSESLSRNVFMLGVTSIRKGIYVADDFIRSQQHLDIFLKDGHSLFKERSQVIRDRLYDQNKTTSILIVHPDYEFMGAVANMDDRKHGKPEVQKEDCIKAIRFLQTLATEARDLNIDVTKNTTFRGIKLVPTWHGFVGDSEAYMYLYYTRPHHGELIRITCERARSGNPIYEDLKAEVADIVRHDSQDLWGYEIQAKRA